MFGSFKAMGLAFRLLSLAVSRLNRLHAAPSYEEEDCCECGEEDDDYIDYVLRMIGGRPWSWKSPGRFLGNNCCAAEIWTRFGMAQTP
jgi:hypothetical protein